MSYTSIWIYPNVDCLRQAREEIFITDWWLSPELYLRRGADREAWRLTSLLRSKAVRTVLEHRYLPLDGRKM